MVINGTESNINAALNGLTFTPTANYNGSANLQITTALFADQEGLYTFNAGNATDDSVGISQNGTLQNGASTVVDSTRGTVLSLDGVDDRVQIAGLFGNPANVTLAAWVNLNQADTAGSELISLGDNVAIRLDGLYGVAGFYFDGTTWQNIGSFRNVAATGWHHIAFSFDDVNDVQRLFIDGQMVASANFTSSISYTRGTVTRIGTHGVSDTNADFNGKIDDARIYTRALTASEIASLAADQTSQTSAVAITVNPVNDAPAFTNLNGTPSFTENGSFVKLDADVTIFDTELSVANNFSGATLTLARNGGANSQDQLVFDGVNVTVSGANVIVSGVTVGTYTFSGGQMAITFNANATNARVNTVMQNILYANASDAPPSSVQMNWTFNDGNSARKAAAEH